MFNETFLVKTVEDQETFSRPGQASSLKISVVFQYPNKTDNELRITFYGDRVKDAMILHPGDKVNVGFTIKSSCSQKGFWGTYVTGIFLKVEESADDIPHEYSEHLRSVEKGKEEGATASEQLGLDNIPFQDPDDLPF